MAMVDASTTAPTPAQTGADRDRSRRRRARVSGGAMVVALAGLLGTSACLPPLGQPCPAVGDDPVGQVDPGDLGAVSDALEARFPACFGGIVRTGDLSAVISVVGDNPPVLALAQVLAGPDYTVTVRSSDHTLADVRALKHQVDADADELHAAGIPTNDTGIKIVAAGPRVLVGIDPDTAAARTALETRYGADWLLILHYGPVIP
jgi:hypothetical protein